MVDYNLLEELSITDEMVDEELAKAFGDDSSADKIKEKIETALGAAVSGTLLKGKIVGLAGNDVIVDVGLKSEGMIAADEWGDKSQIDIGDEIDVWLDTVESDSGLVQLSKRKADRLLSWQRIVKTTNEGDEVKGKVMRKIKGGLLVDIGVPVFLPASQVDIRRPGDIGELIGREIEASVLKIDTDRRNIVISRRKLLEERRREARDNLLSGLEVGQKRKGIVKNVADFGAFVDLGGIDGLLHITDMSWDRVHHPSAILRIDEEIEVTILNIDAEHEKIALGLKQQTEDPWMRVEEKYPIESMVHGEVVNIMNYGAFVKIEAGVEGLVHISEMSWTRRINHPSEMLSLGDQIDVVVLDINKDKHEISLGIKQTETNPWTTVAAKYPPNTRVTGTVRNLTNYGAFVEIEEGIDGLLHVSDMSWTKKISHPSEILAKGQELECVVLKVEEEKQRIALGIRQLTEDPWEKAVPENYIPGQIVEGTVTKITNFGVFVELEQDLEGLLHVSELADHKIENAHDEVSIGDKIQVKILRVDPVDRKIGLSKKRAEWAAEDAKGEDATDATAAKKERRGGLIGSAEIGTDLISRELLNKPKPESDAESSDAESPAVAEAAPEAEAAAESETKPEAAPESEAAPEAAESDNSTGDQTV